MAVSILREGTRSEGWGAAVLVLVRATCSLLVHGLVGFGRPATLCRQHGRVRR